MTHTKTLHSAAFFEESVQNSSITKERKELLYRIATKIVSELKNNTKINLTFICTHNSRRSQIAQVWSFFAASYFNLDMISSFSGGTETTSFHRNTVKTLQNAGFKFNVIDFSHQNPKYLISFNESKKYLIGFSKVYDAVENNSPFIAITTCSSADKNCPYISTAIDRFHLPYTDPKHSDNTPLTKATYLETNQQIAGEIFILFETIKNKLA